jgi:hypothetical protein
MLKPAILFTALAVTAFVFTNGCKKDQVDTETTSATDNNICEGEFMRLLPTVNKIAIDESGVHRLGWQGGNSVQANDPSVTVPDSLNQYPRHMIIDYGTGITDAVDGKVRKGKIRALVSLPWDSVGSVITMTLDTFYVGAIQYQGTITLTRTATDAFTMTVTDGKCTKNTGDPWTILFACTRNFVFTSGANSSTATQIVSITGTNTGTDRNGKNWTAEITSPIIRDLSCSWINKGTMTLTPEGLAVRTIDFGDGTCDNKGTITIDGNTFEFTMN